MNDNLTEITRRPKCLGCGAGVDGFGCVKCGRSRQAALHPPRADQGVIEGLEDSGQFDHPMWTAPKAKRPGQEDMPTHVLTMRRMLAGRLVPYYGKAGDHKVILLFAEQVWTTSTLTDASDPAWLIGHIWLLRSGLVRSLEARRFATTGYLHSRLTQFIEVIDRWTRELSAVIADTHNSGANTGAPDPEGT